MKRWHEDLPKTLRQWKMHRRDHVESNKTWVREPGRDPYEVDCPCDDQVGRFRKRDAHDCGNPGCLVCHSDKFPKREMTEQEKKSELSYKEQLREYLEKE